MLFPIRDENPLVRPPVATIVLIGINLACWGLLQGLSLIHISEPTRPY